MESLLAAVDELCGVDPAVLGDGDTVLVLYRAIARLEAVAAAASAAFDASKEWQADGAKSAIAWLARTSGLDRGTVYRRCRLGKRVAEMPVAAAAWRAGDIAPSHVSVLADANNERTGDAFARDEDMLVGFAKELRFKDFCRSVQYWSQHADQDGAEDRAAKAFRDRKANLSRTFDDSWVGEQFFDPIGGTIVNNELTRLERMLFDDDWKEAQARLGRDPLLHDLCRSPAQRRADAYVEMATRSASMSPGSRRPAPLFCVFVGWETFSGRLCQLADGTAITPGRLLSWLDEAYVRRVVFDGPSRVIDVGVDRRLFDGATREAVLLRDHECYHDFCDVPSQDCQVDHIVPYGQGGPTEQGNGRPACGYHNRRRNDHPDDEDDPPPD